MQTNHVVPSVPAQASNQQMAAFRQQIKAIKAQIAERTTRREENPCLTVGERMQDVRDGQAIDLMRLKIKLCYKKIDALKRHQLSELRLVMTNNVTVGSQSPKFIGPERKMKPVRLMA